MTPCPTCGLYVQQTLSKARVGKRAAKRYRKRLGSQKIWPTRFGLGDSPPLCPDPYHEDE